MNDPLDAVFDAAFAHEQPAADALREAAQAAHSGSRRRDGHADPGARPDREPFSRRPLSVLRMPSAGQQRPSHADPAQGDRRHPLRLCDGGRGHSRNEHLFLDLDRAGRLRHAGRRLRTQPRRRAAGPAGGDQSGKGGRPPPLRRRRARPHQSHRVAVARRQQSGLSRGDVRRVCASPTASRSAA